MTGIIDGLLVYPENMKKNLDSMKGMVFSGQVLLELAKKGLSREEAYRIVQRNAMEVWAGKGDLKSLLAEDPDIQKWLTKDELEAPFDLDRQLRYVDTIYQRVFESG
jgi:adenylosuccinate lyase